MGISCAAAIAYEIMQKYAEYSSNEKTNKDNENNSGAKPEVDDEIQEDIDSGNEQELEEICTV